MTAAEKLLGLTLTGGWNVVRYIARGANGTGGMFSHSYEVENAGKRGFLKAFDFVDAFSAGVDTLEVIQKLIGAYFHERDILTHCRDRRLSNIVLALDHGYIQVPDFTTAEGRVYYLILELADGDVRCQMDADLRHDAVWCMHVMKSACLGLWQIHREMIAHQDVKPSNILVYGSTQSKIADFGRSARKGRPVWHDDHNCAGDRSYAPPELLYGYLHPDFGPRRIGCDLFMLGNLASFLFTGVNVQAGIFSRLAEEFRPENWSATYEAVLPYLQEAFSRFLVDLTPQIAENVRHDIIPFIRQLCNPDLSRRGHPRSVGRPDQYSLERCVSDLDRIWSRLRVTLKVKAAVA